MSTPWKYGIAALALLLALTGLVIAWNSYTEGLIQEGYNRGKTETEAAYAQRDNKKLLDALAAQKAATKRAEDAEAKAADAQALASNNYQKGIQDGKLQTEKRLGAVRAGTLRLSDPGKAGSAACGDRIAPTEVAASASGSDGQTGADLSRSASEFLLDLTAEADETAKQLAAAQAIIISDRQLCNLAR